MSSGAPFQPLQFSDSVISGLAWLGSAPLGRSMAPPAGDVSRELQESIRRALGRPRIHLLLRARLETKPRRLEERILALTAWRLHLFGPTTPAKIAMRNCTWICMPICVPTCTKIAVCCQAEGSLSVLEIRCISATSPTQVPTTSQCRPVWASADW
ncbi:capping protein, Arp2/3 and myosin-I linker protein 3-like isoform X1 [Lagopus leucura]|uniref:capping protein, Arp2/3 and myosin-I linker protein 3-like isoform X1 n=1 Tax=Lagopus leucura TaxID=30410 RepID=UPI001C677714|nr:capping protein, Arp2/3 and myosin-I linker protein 3-like isoform X1 [Lagopus leucura]